MNSGARLRNLHLAAALAQHCSVTLLQLLAPREQFAATSPSPPFEQILATRRSRGYTPAKIVKGLLGPVPLTVLNYASTEAERFLARLLETVRFDTIQLEGAHVFAYLDLIRRAHSRPAILLDWHNIESELLLRYASETRSWARRFVAQRTGNLLRQLESRVVGICDAHTVVSEREKAELLRRNRAARVEVVPNGVDTTGYSSAETTSSPGILLFVGSMDYHANIDAVVWFVRSMWPAISRRFPMLEFTIVGRSPAREVQILASEKIHVTGTVEDVRPFYSNALAVVVPLRVGGGTRLKILEAMAMGVPVISTTLGAEGLAVTPGRNILLADSEEEIIAATARLLRDPDFRRVLADAGRQLVSEHYDWSSIGNRLYCIHTSLVETPRRQLT